MLHTILITGGFGFLGRAAANHFKHLGWRVVGIGHGQWGSDEALAHGFDRWLDSSISLSSLMTLDESFDLVLHSAGTGSVGSSLLNPLQDFTKTVQGTIELLEFLRLCKSKALLIYPSSAAVYGAKEDFPIKETDSLNPISPYGYHKRIAEELLESYSKAFDIRVAIIRFFSIYGPGLMKQLLWDASAKFLAFENSKVTFWGNGEETRDWISIEDAMDLVVAATNSEESFIVLNGGSGERVTVRQSLNLLKDAMGVDTEIVFNGIVREGDPRFYHADVRKALLLGWKPSITLIDGIKNYVSWRNSYQGCDFD